MAELIRVGIDTGGTFTDFVVARASRIRHFKIPSTPHNPAAAILAGIARVLEEGVRGAGTDSFPAEIVHGTTVATNALLERKGARAALVTTGGFEDVLEIGRQARPEIYNFFVTRPAPLIPRTLRFGVGERIASDGAVLTALDEAQLEAVIRQIEQEQVEAVAVCLLFSFANPAHERRISDALARLDIPVSLSHKILPEYREYERTSTVCINAYLAPLMSRYLSSLEQGIAVLQRQEQRQGEAKTKRPAKARAARRTPLRVMQSNGGSVSAQTAGSEPVRAILSGPAGGVVGALQVCKAAGVRHLITFDMGGTSTDVALCRGEARTTNEATVAGLPVAVPIIDIHTVGAGGGSIARVDEAGALRVGPESAGADPGPACYGRGEAVTVTDANLLLGRFGLSSLLGGEMRLDSERARVYLAALAAEMSRFSGRKVSPEQAALGVVRVANANMEGALRKVSVERGQDPRLFSLVSFGGAGGLHVCELAAALRIERVIVPRSPGTLSALGVLLGDVVKDYSQTVMVASAKMNLRLMERHFAALEKTARRELAAEGFNGERVRLARAAAVRYVGQSFEIDVRWGDRFEKSFHALHKERYGYADRSRPTEVVSLRLRAVGVTDKPRLQRAAARGEKAPEPASIAKVYLTQRPSRVPVYAREELKAGARFSGPAVITEYSSTTLVPSGWSVEVDAWLNLLIT